MSIFKGVLSVVLIPFLLTFAIYAGYRRGGQDSNPPKEIRTTNRVFEIKQLYLNRVRQFHSGELNTRQFRDSLAIDIDTFFINNPSI